jgi:hypothetical protein
LKLPVLPVLGSWQKTQKGQLEMKFNLPPGITFTKTRIEDQWVYTFRHKDLGNIGRIRLKGTGGNNTMINLDVIGDPNDPMTARRREIFEPIGMGIANQMESVVGEGTVEPVPTPLPTQDKTLVKSQIMQCVKCDAYVAMLVFADNALTPDRLEDYAQMMYPKYSEMGLPTWVIGAPLNNSMDAPAYFLKVWPEREPACLLTPDEFDPVICKLQGSHCS